MAGKVTVGLVDSKGNLLAGLYLHTDWLDTGMRSAAAATRTQTMELLWDWLYLY